MNIHKLEIACFNIQSALIAQEGGADRIELCADLSAGGITPHYETVEEVRKLITIDLFVMIRPRGGNFFYTDEEVKTMTNDLLHFKQLNVNGVVFGILHADGRINKEQNKQLVELAKPLLCTFHRAFDVCSEATIALEDVIDCKFQTILTSGQSTSANDGIQQLSTIVKNANGRIDIMPGGGIRSSNIETLKEKVKTSYYHSSAIIHQDIADLNEVKMLKEKLSHNNIIG